MNNIKVY